jgi:hypothetical protein
MLLRLPALLLFGILAGSLANYLSDVPPHTRRFSLPACRHCQQTLSFWKYVFLCLCPQCSVRCSALAWIVQIFYPLAFVSLAIFPPNHLNLLPAAALLVYFGPVVIMDVEHRVILQPVSLAGALFGLGSGQAGRHVLLYRP